MKPQDVSRRDFLRQAAWSGAALTLAAYMPAHGRMLPEIINPVTNRAAPGTELMSWISISSTGKVRLMCSRSEMGQGTFQALPQMLAEELEVRLDDVEIIFAPANPEKYGPQPQEGSFSVRGWAPRLLRTGACAREMLIEVAATEWNIPRKDCYAENGTVIHRVTQKKLAYGALVEKAAKLQPPAEVVLKNRSEYKIIGKPAPRKDIPLKTNGSAIFGLDKKLPGMKYAVIERSRRFRETVRSFDDSETIKVPGVSHVLR